MVDTVGLVGVGAMGAALLERMNVAGLAVRAFDISEDAREAARKADAVIAGSPADVARAAPVIHVIVRTDEQVLDATLGADGVLAGAGEGARLILHSTILPPTTIRINEAAARQGVAVIDAPITAVPRLVHAGQATFLVGGPDDVVAELRPHLQSLGRDVCHFGPLTSGNVAKIAKNLTNGIERVMLYEVATMAGAGGLDVRQFLDMAKAVSHGAAVENWERIFDIVDGHAVPHPAPHGNLYDKDVPHAAALAEWLGLELPLTRATAERVKSWMQSW